MKTEMEIRRKIDELFNKEREFRDTDYEADEAICNQIDALLWVIGDRSGKEI